ncbi:MAG TPA: hypothetical protein VJG32_19455 [Anaerolineae bacterium]|nr:hypothetical protein [Anaerolineae bacterium]
MFPSYLRHPKLMLVLIALLLVAMPAPVRAACWAQLADVTPQPLAEPCDSVLLSYSSVSISIIVFDIALIVATLAAPRRVELSWSALLDQRLFARSFNLILDPPPPRLRTA